MAWAASPPLDWPPAMAVASLSTQSGTSSALGWLMEAALALVICLSVGTAGMMPVSV